MNLPCSQSRSALKTNSASGADAIPFFFASSSALSAFPPPELLFLESSNSSESLGLLQGGSSSSATMPLHALSSFSALMACSSVYKVNKQKSISYSAVIRTRLNKTICRIMLHVFKLKDQKINFALKK